MTEPEEIARPETSEEKPEEGERKGETLSCPICGRALDSPLQDICAHCNAPVQPILRLLRLADLSVTEALRDITIGELDSALRRIKLVRVISKAHRLKAEVLEAIVKRLKGDPQGALARLAAVKAEMSENTDEELNLLIEETEKLALEEQKALALCCEQYNFALFQAKRGHYEEATLALTKALASVPHHAPSHALMAKVKLALRDVEEAKYHLRRALALDPTNKEASKLIAYLGGKPAPLIKWSRVMDAFRASPEWAVSAFIVLAIIFLALTAILAR